MKKPILFLDIDGVLNSLEFGGDFKDYNDGLVCMLDPNACALLASLLEKIDCDVVLSSSWRTCYSLKRIQNCLKERDCPIVFLDKTPVIRSTEDTSRKIREEEILLWLEKNPGYEKICILDDRDDFDSLGKFLVLTSFVKGLQKEHLRKITELLS